MSNSFFLKEHADDCRGAIIYTVYKNGVPVERVEDYNLVVNGGRTRLAQMIAGKDFRHITKIGFGTSLNQPKLTEGE